MQDEISWNDNTYYEIYNPYSDISPLEGVINLSDEPFI